ncbi:hypothetical protein TNCV_4588701 [Trichonephila clavipes]|nr:hypothetical protein TNCV_4588701 [Trichonephila clavipes]
MLLNGSTSILPNSPLQPSVTSITYGPWYTTFATSLILDGPILPCMVWSAMGPMRDAPGVEPIDSRWPDVIQLSRGANGNCLMLELCANIRVIAQCRAA